MELEVSRSHWLEYRTEDGIVEVIHEERPERIAEGREVAESPHFRPGQEVEYRIKVYVDEAVDEEVRSHAAVRQGPPVQEIMDKLKELEEEVAELKARR